MVRTMVRLMTDTDRYKDGECIVDKFLAMEGMEMMAIEREPLDLVRLRMMILINFFH